uniref:Uncharacterized protein n=1 Tax=Glossina palpalis gambiensis TaxID=67801 RepID=A0A1B0BJ95_9MUSC
NTLYGNLFHVIKIIINIYRGTTTEIHLYCALVHKYLPRQEICIGYRHFGRYTLSVLAEGQHEDSALKMSYNCAIFKKHCGICKEQGLSIVDLIYLCLFFFFFFFFVLLVRVKH